MTRSTYLIGYTPNEIKKAANKIGITPASLRKRLRSGMTMRQALATPKASTSVETKEKARKSRLPYTKEQIQEGADKCGMSYASFSNRLYRGMSFDDAVKTGKMNKSQAGKIGAKKSPWREQKICRGSVDFSERRS